MQCRHQTDNMSLHFLFFYSWHLRTFIAHHLVMTNVPPIRRNVKSDVSSAVNPCRQFFTLEVHARVFAAALKVLRMANLEEEPGVEIPFSGDRCPKEDKKKYLKFVCEKVVDEFVIDESKNERTIKSLDRINLQEKAKALSMDSNNRYRCRYEICQKSFAKYGKRMKDHEASHTPPILGIVEQSVVVDTTSSDEEQDMFSYQKALLEYGMLILNFWDAISEGDGERLMRCWRFFLLYLRTGGQSTTSHINVLLSPQATQRFIWNRSVKNKNCIGGNIHLDLQLEFYNRMRKAAVNERYAMCTCVCACVSY